MARGASSINPSAPTFALRYLRVSTDEQARDGLSLGAQDKATREYAERQGWELVEPVFQDEIKGTRDDRPGYQTLLAETRRLRQLGQPAAVVCVKLDRFGRRLVERVRAREELKSLEVPIHSVLEGGEVSDLVANILASVAQEEVRQLGERVSLIRQTIIANGDNYPGKSGWGFLYRPATPEERARGTPKSVLDLDPEEYPYVQQLYQKARAGSSVRKLSEWAARLPEEARGGYTEVVERDGELVQVVHEGRHLGTTAIRRILRSPLYVARPYQGDPDVLSRPLGNWPRIVDDETWAEVQAILDGGGHEAPNHRGVRYLLTGFLRCPRCGHGMVGRSGRNKAGNHQSQYVCGAANKGAAAPAWRHGKPGRLPKGVTANPTFCQMTVLRAPVEEAVLAEIANLLAAFDQAEGWELELGDFALEVWRRLRDAWTALTRPDGGEQAQVEYLQREVAKLEARLTRLTTLYADGELSRDAYQAASKTSQAELTAKRTELGKLLRRARAAQPPAFEDALDMLRAGKAAVESGDVEAQRRMLADLVDHIDPVKVGWGKYTATTYWTEQGERLRQFADVAAELTAWAEHAEVRASEDEPGAVDLVDGEGKPLARARTAGQGSVEVLEVDFVKAKDAAWREAHGWPVGG